MSQSHHLLSMDRTQGVKVSRNHMAGEVTIEWRNEQGRFALTMRDEQLAMTEVAIHEYREQEMMSGTCVVDLREKAAPVGAGTANGWSPRF